MNKEYFLYIENKFSDKLVVFFSAASSKNFTGYKLIENLNVNKLFIRDPYRNWYNGNIDGVSENANDLTSKILIITKQYNNRNIYFIGGSMGGYASLLFGIKLNVGNILAFSPQMILDSRMPNMPNKSHKIMYKNLYDIFDTYHIENININIWFGAENLIDIQQLQNVKKYKTVNIFPLKFYPHDVMTSLNKQNLLINFISHNIGNKKFNFGYALNQSFFNDEMTEKINQSILAFFDNDYTLTIKILNSLSNDFYSSGIFYYLGQAYFRNKNLEKSEIAYNAGLNLYPLSEDILYQLTRLCMVTKNFDLGEKSILRNIEIASTESAISLNALGSIYMLQNKLEKSLSTQLKALQIDSKNSEIHYQLGLVYFKLFNYGKSLSHYKISFSINPNKINLKQHILNAQKKYIETILKDFGYSSKNELLNFIDKNL